MKFKIIGIILFLLLLGANPVQAAAPVANAGADVLNVLEFQSVLLNASASFDPDGDPITFSWSQISGQVATILSDTSSTPTILLPDVPVGGDTLTFELTVSDGVLSSTDTVDITVRDSTSNSAPLADAGLNQTVVSGATVTLDATGSIDPDGDPLSFFWTPPIVPAVALSNRVIANPEFTAPAVAVPTDLTFEVRVSDGLLIDTAQVTITVNPAAPGDFAMELMVEEAKAKLKLKKSNRDKVEVEGEFWLHPDSDDIVIGTNGDGKRFIEENVTVRFDGRPEFEETIPAGSLVERRRLNHYKYKVKHPTGPVHEMKIEYVPGEFHGEFEVEWDTLNLQNPPSPTVEEDIIASDPSALPSVPVPFDLDIGNDNGEETGINFKLEKDRRHKRVYEFEKEDDDDAGTGGGTVPPTGF